MQVAPSQISPSEAFDVWYFIKNHTDSTTYYIRALVYDVKTGEVLATVNLDQSPTNSRLFIKTLQAPADPVGYGRNIVAIATVYTDSGYTTKSQDYEEQEQYFLIKTAPVVLGGGGGGIDLRALKEFIEETLDKKLKAIPKPKDFPNMPFGEVLIAIGAIQRDIDRVPKDATDLAPVNTALEALKAQISDLPEPEKVDLSHLATSIREVLNELQTLRRDNSHAASSMLATMQRSMGDIAGGISDKILSLTEKALKDLMGRQKLVIPLDALIKDRENPTEETSSKEEFDVKHLM